MDDMISTELFKLFIDKIWVVYVITHIFCNMGEITIIVTFPFKIEMKFKGKTGKSGNSLAGKSDAISEN